MSIIDRILKNFAKNLEYNQEGKFAYAKLLSHFNQEYENFQDVVNMTNYWILLFLLHIDTILVVDSSNRTLFKPKYKNQISEIFSSQLKKHVPVTQTILGFRIFGKEFVDEEIPLSDLEVYITAKNLVSECSDTEVFTSYVRALINDFSTKEPRFYRTEFPRWFKKVKYNHIDSAIETGFLNYIRRGGVFADAMLKGYKKFQTNPNGFNIFIWHNLWKDFKETVEYKIIYRELEKFVNNY